MVGWLRKKSSIIFIGVAILIVLFLLVSFDVLFPDGNRVVVLTLSGVIKEEGSSNVYITPRFIDGELDKLERVGAVVLRINSPGGSVAASQEILDRLNRFKKDTGIPLVISMGETATSGGYYISLGGDVIVANPGTLTGSIGVVSEFIYLDEMLKKLGLEKEIVKSGRYKGMGSQPLTEEERLLIQTLSDGIYEQFIREIVTYRKMDIKDVRQLATGELYTGEQAEKLGLVDKLGSLDYAVDIAAELAGVEDPDIVIKYPGGILGGMFSMLKDTFGGPGLRIRW